MLPGLVCPTAGGTKAIGLQSCQLILLKHKHELFTYLSQNEDGLSLLFFKRKGKENPQIVLLSAKVLHRQVLSKANLAHPHGPLQ